jgi:hypothetical protein
VCVAASGSDGRRHHDRGISDDGEIDHGTTAGECGQIIPENDPTCSLSPVNSNSSTAATGRACTPMHTEDEGSVPSGDRSRLSSTGECTMFAIHSNFSHHNKYT